MKRIGLFYGSTTDNTARVVGMVKGELDEAGYKVDLYDIAGGCLDDMKSYNLLILATPTWDGGELQEDWQYVYDDFAKLDFSGKRVAFLGLGDQVEYPENFSDGIGTLAQPVYLNGGQVVGHWPSSEYEFSESAASEDNFFVGLVVDQDNEAELTRDRIKRWVRKLKKEF